MLRVRRSTKIVLHVLLTSIKISLVERITMFFIAVACINAKYDGVFWGGASILDFTIITGVCKVLIAMCS